MRVADYIGIIQVKLLLFDIKVSKDYGLQWVCNMDLFNK